MHSSSTGSRSRYTLLVRPWAAALLAGAVGATLLAATTTRAHADETVPTVTTAPDPGTDITGNGGKITAQYKETGAESESMLIDDDVTTKYFTIRSAMWVQYESPTAETIDRYTLTSANDAPDRDPKDWTLQGSLDGSTWTVIDTRTDQKFSARNQTRGFSVTPGTAYTHYRLVVSETTGSPDSQLAEWELWAGGNGVPAAPSRLTSTLDGDAAVLNWTDNSSNDTGYAESGFQIERSIDGGPFEPLATAGADVRTYTDPGLAPETAYSYRIRAVGVGNGLSEYSNTTKLSVSVFDITDMPGTLTDRYSKGGTEGSQKVADNSPYTKYLADSGSTWVQYQPAGSSRVSGYSITSANDASGRDPKDWTLRGSTDGTTWTDLDTRSGESFTKRHQKKSYTVDTDRFYRYFRLDVTANNGAAQTQVAEWELLGTANTETQVDAPEAPSDLSGKAVSGDQAVLEWTDNSRTEQSFRLERSLNGTDWDWSRVLPNGTTRYIDLGLTENTTYHYRLRAENAGGRSAYTTAVSATTPAGDMPATWQEHWLEHIQLLNKVYENDDVAIYFDDDMDRSQTWLNDYVTKLWKYTKQNYDSFSNPQLAAIFHQGKYGGGHPATVFDGSHDYRNVIDMGLGDWIETDTQPRNLISHELAHVVEFSAYGVNGSPAFKLWGDSKWAEIYQYDAYLGAGLTADAESWYSKAVVKTDNFPRANTAWFRDWFFPIWRDHGKSEALDSFFRLTAEHFAQHNGAYIRDMNMGEFVHFWSGAAGADLREQAETAFGWTDEYEAQLQQARLDFPGVSYPQS
ncbi:discoidin domain-containing protein [Streptomyces sp. NPDC044984]|uniref:fibronectin type III domain-containing protein n=1 Tax=Streptomyces sp. NPDC044984 TaxID=3154335 RepID=UPI003411728B